MEIMVDFPGGARVDAHFEGFTIPTDQPAPDGEGTAPTPFTTFLASIGACAGIYVLSFCRQRGIPAEDIRIVQRMARNTSGYVSRIYLDILLPPDFPEKYRDAVVRAADQCLVKKHLEQPPLIEVRAVTGEPTPG